MTPLRDLVPASRTQKRQINRDQTVQRKRRRVKDQIDLHALEYFATSRPQIKSLDEVDIHNAKVKEIRQILTSILARKLGDGRTLVIAGPPGTGKKTVVELLARELGLIYEVADLSDLSERSEQSPYTLVEDALHRPVPLTTNFPILLVLDKTFRLHEMPAFFQAVREKTESTIWKAVVFLTTAVEGLKTMQDRVLKEDPNVQLVTFNPVAPTIMKKALYRALGLAGSAGVNGSLDHMVAKSVAVANGSLSAGLNRLALEIAGLQHKLKHAYDEPPAVLGTPNSSGSSDDFSQSRSGPSTIFSLVGRCLYNKHVPLHVLESASMVPQGTSAKAELLHAFLTSLPPCALSSSLDELFAPIDAIVTGGWTKPRQITERLSFILSQAPPSLVLDSHRASVAEQDWYCGLSESTPTSTARSRLSLGCEPIATRMPHDESPLILLDRTCYDNTTTPPAPAARLKMAESGSLAASNRLTPTQSEYTPTVFATPAKSQQTRAALLRRPRLFEPACGAPVRVDPEAAIAIKFDPAGWRQPITLGPQLAVSFSGACRMVNLTESEQDKVLGMLARNMPALWPSLEDVCRGLQAVSAV